MNQFREQNYRKRSRGGAKIVVTVCVVAIVAGVLLYGYRAIMHRGDGEGNGSGTGSGQFGASQIFESGDAGYSLAVPSDWRIEQGDGGSVAVYPSSASCKIDIASFAAVKESDRAAWIGKQLGKDPAVNVAEQSSEQVSVGGAPAIRWDGTMGGIPAVFVYAFAPQHTYEIAPSIIDGNGNDNSSDGDGVASCEDALTTLMADIQFSATQQDAFTSGVMDDVAATTTATTTDGSVLGAATTSEVTASANDTDDEDCL
jgi:xanthine/CO dehydrogenase XdhC/CoxF family maturation factor